MEWFYVILAGIFEMLGVTMMNQLQQKSKENESQTLSSDSSQSLKKIIKKQSSTFICLLFGFGLSFYFLNLAMQTLPMSIAYPIWTGIGAIGSAVIGMIWYQESRDWRRILFILLILGATIGLKLIT